ncbi:MAG TPA: hypothetical protein VGD63_10905 [Steroidobacteraceae bacterium]
MTEANEVLGSASNITGNTYRRRALLYAKLDRQLCRSTRFFGAASATNAVLCDLLVPQRRWAISRRARRFLAEVGTDLEIMNVDSALRIARGDCRTDDLDRAMVEAEQRAVQSSINDLHNRDPVNLSKMLRELDDVLNGASFGSLFGRMCEPAASYIGVLQQVRRNLGRSILFVRQEDRESIGCTLIHHLRGSNTLITSADWSTFI